MTDQKKCSIEVLAKNIKIVLTDVDGILTNSLLIYDAAGSRMRAFNARDGAAIQWLAESGIPVGFISAIDDLSTRKRAEDLGVEELHLGTRTKFKTVSEIAKRRCITLEEVAYFGDDLMDFSALKSVGLAGCPSDAANEVRDICQLVLSEKGGDGFFRAAAEFILKAQGKWDDILLKYSLLP